MLVNEVVHYGCGISYHKSIFGIVAGDLSFPITAFTDAFQNNRGNIYSK